MSAERFSLNSPALPVDPEAVTRSLGSTLATRHGVGGASTRGVVVAGSPVLSLHHLAAHLVAAAEQRGGVVSIGPLEGRDLRELADLAERAVDGLPIEWPVVPVRPGLNLDHCMISTRGDVEVVGQTVWGDRHLDLAAAAVGVAARFGSAVVAPLVDAYGADGVDLLTLDVCQQLNAVATEVGWPDVGTLDRA